MVFNSIGFAIFLPVVFFLYWFVTQKSLRAQNFLLLISSYFFYACWDWRFLFLLIFSTLLDYLTGLMIAGATDGSRKKWLWLSIIVNLGFLGVFKYYNFFAESFSEALSAIGVQANPKSLDVILPVGISFYTFHGLSYVIDIYYKRINAERNFIDYAVFVSFFPLLVAGPIERATHLLPQIKQKREFDYGRGVDGLKQILWGLFKKVVIADNCALLADEVFNNSDTYTGGTLVLGALFFAFQIYGDFSGYSDIALGTARLLGIELLRNFAFPYFSRDIAEFWRRWHISLSSWFRDYVYIPLGGSRGGTWTKVRNIFIIFGLSGFWHGANWTFILWGFLHAVYFLPLLLTNKNRSHLEIVASGKSVPNLHELFSMLLTFCMVVFAWIFFRADSISHAVSYVSNLFVGLFKPQAYLATLEFLKTNVGIVLPALVILFMIVEWMGREQQYALASLGKSASRVKRWSAYYLLMIIVFWYAGKNQQFIYFQF